MNATQQLPPSYQSVEIIDVSKDRRLLVLLNIAGVSLMLLVGWAFLALAARLRGQALAESVNWLSVHIPGWIPAVAAFILLTVFYILVHEAFHGIFFWLFTRSRPKFAFRGAYAYAAAPGWFVRRNAYLLTALAPLGFMSLIGLLIIAAAPPAWILPAWLVITMNAGGATGDLWVAFRLLRRPRHTYICDRGDSVTFFEIAHSIF